MTFEMRRSEPAHAGVCAKKVRALNRQIMGDNGGVDDYDAEQLCDTER